MICRICCRRPVLSGGRTCGDSHCQEADYYENRARNTRGRMRGEAFALASQKAAIASERSPEEGGVR
jgi:hypothetical protein